MKPAAFPAVAFFATIIALTGCGAGSPNCVSGIALGAEPAAAVISSTAKAPANQQQFLAGETLVSLQGNCPIPAIARIVYPAWINPDPIHITLSTANDPTNGTAVCKGPTSGPVTLTATDVGPNNTAKATVQLTCQ